MRSTIVRPPVPFRPLLGLALLAALAVPSAARAQDDEEEVSGSVNVGGLPGAGGFNMNFSVKDGSKKKADANVVVTGTSTRREEYSSSTPGQAFKLIYEEGAGGATRFKVLAPESYGVKVSDGATVLLQDSIPASVDVVAGRFYRIEVFTPQAVVFDKKFEAKAGMVGSLWVTAGAMPSTNVQVVVQAPPPPPPAYAPPPVAAAPAATCMGADDLGSIKEAIEGEGFSDGKVGVLESAAPDRWFCVAQVIEVLELYAFSEDKLKALRIMKPRIADPKNNFKIIGALTFSSDKDAAKKILQ